LALGFESNVRKGGGGVAHRGLGFGSPAASSDTGGERWRGSGDRRWRWISERRAEEDGELGDEVE
jgi:hypothetical protein